MDDRLFFVCVKALLKKSNGACLLLKKNPDRLKLLNINNAHYWDLPGGKIKSNQQPLDALKAEILEETGIDQSAYTIINPVSAAITNIQIPYKDSTHTLVAFTFECILLNENVEIKLSHEHISYEWHQLDTIQEKLGWKDYPLILSTRTKQG